MSEETETRVRFQTNVARGFDAGNHANAYETQDYERALAKLSPNRPPEYVAAFTLGFFSSYSLDEIPAGNREAFDAAYQSEGGKQCLAAGYCDDRADEYKAEESATHWGYGSGTPGCLFDNGPCFTETKEQAIEGVLFPFQSGNETDLSESELEQAKRDLCEDGTHYFPSERRGDLGASYVQIWEEQGPCPDNDD